MHRRQLQRLLFRQTGTVVSTRATSNYEVVFPAKVSPQVHPDELLRGSLRVKHLPSYAFWEDRGKLAKSPGFPEVKDSDTIIRMRRACAVAREILTCAGRAVVTPGLTTDELDRLVLRECLSRGAYPSPLNYRGFPKSVCTSVNNCACHGIPDDRPLADGDIVNVDITVFVDGVHGDCSRTFCVGDKLDDAGRRLVRVAEDCLDAGISACGPGKAFSNVGAIIQSLAEKSGYSVVASFTGHGIGTYFHGPPDIYHVRNSYPGKMQPGMTFTVEPIISEGSAGIGILEDGWTAVSLDNSRSAQFEHTLLITEQGVEVLTV